LSNKQFSTNVLIVIFQQDKETAFGSTGIFTKY
jgi:hypothetical protein